MRESEKKNTLFYSVSIKKINKSSREDQKCTNTVNMNDYKCFM